MDCLNDWLKSQIDEDIFNAVLNKHRGIEFSEYEKAIIMDRVMYHAKVKLSQKLNNLLN